MHNFKKQQNNKGFTLIEALVAISILMVAVAAPITIAQKGLSSAAYSKNQMIASYLAQDVIEYIKNKRDEYTINRYTLRADNIRLYNSDWNDLQIFDDCREPDSCQINTIKDIGAAVLLGSPIQKLRRDSNGFYGYEEKIDDVMTNFSRVVNIEMKDLNGGNNEALITVTVDWGTDSLEVKTLIYNF